MELKEILCRRRGDVRGIFEVMKQRRRGGEGRIKASKVAEVVSSGIIILLEKRGDFIFRFVNL